MNLPHIRSMLQYTRLRLLAATKYVPEVDQRGLK